MLYGSLTTCGSFLPAKYFGTGVPLNHLINLFILDGSLHTCGSFICDGSLKLNGSFDIPVSIGDNDYSHILVLSSLLVHSTLLVLLL